MREHTSAPDGGSLVRSILIGLGFVLLFSMGQWIAALVLSVSYGGADVLTRLRRSLVRRELERAQVAQEVGVVASKQSGSAPVSKDSKGSKNEHDLVVERRPRKDAPSGDSGKSEAGEGKKSGGIMGKYHAFMDRHPSIQAFIGKFGKDNIGMLAGYVSWAILTSLVPLIVGLMAITTLFLRDPGTQKSVIDHLASATQGFSAKDIHAIVKGSVQHSGLLGLIGFLGVLWGGSSVGGAISTIFQAIFEVKGRSFIKEKLIDVGMIFVFAALMLIIVLGSAAVPLLTSALSVVPFPGLTFVIGLLVTFVAAFLLFATIYTVFPNIEPPFRFGNTWKGAVVAGILFTLLSQVWNIYAQFQHANKYGAILGALLVLTAWIYFFSMILVIGAEVVAYNAIEEAKREGREIGPEPEESVPQHGVLRDEPITQR